MVAWRNYLPIYPSKTRDEDVVTQVLFRTHRCVAIDSPLLYLYVVTGRNTSDVSHFESHFSRAECCFEGDEFDELSRILSRRLPLLDYAAALNEKHIAEIPRWIRPQIDNHFG